MEQNFHSITLNIHASANKRPPYLFRFKQHSTNKIFCTTYVFVWLCFLFSSFSLVGDGKSSFSIKKLISTSERMQSTRSLVEKHNTPHPPSVTLLYTMPHVVVSVILLSHNHKPPPPNCVTSFMNVPYAKPKMCVEGTSSNLKRSLRGHL